MEEKGATHEFYGKMLERTAQLQNTLADVQSTLKQQDEKLRALELQRERDVGAQEATFRNLKTVWAPLSLVFAALLSWFINWTTAPNPPQKQDMQKLQVELKSLLQQEIQKLNHSKTKNNGG